MVVALALPCQEGTKRCCAGESPVDHMRHGMPEPGPADLNVPCLYGGKQWTMPTHAVLEANASTLSSAHLITHGVEDCLTLDPAGVLNGMLPGAQRNS